MNPSRGGTKLENGDPTFYLYLSNIILSIFDLHNIYGLSELLDTTQLDYKLIDSTKLGTKFGSEHDTDVVCVVMSCDVVVSRNNLL